MTGRKTKSLFAPKAGKPAGKWMQLPCVYSEHGTVSADDPFDDAVKYSRDDPAEKQRACRENMTTVQDADDYSDAECEEEPAREFQRFESEVS